MPRLFFLCPSKHPQCAEKTSHELYIQSKLYIFYEFNRYAVIDYSVILYFQTIKN